jgi:hypothetical protein
MRTVAVLPVLLVVVLPAALPVAASLPGYFEHVHSIGPKSQQYGGGRHLACRSAATCPLEAAAACNATRHAGGADSFHCRSFSILRAGRTCQLYSTDYNESYYVPRWTMWSLSDGPPHAPQPSPPTPGPSEAGRADYCAVKELAVEVAGQLLHHAGAPEVERKQQLVHEALQLDAACHRPFVRRSRADDAPGTRTAPAPPPGVVTVFVEPVHGSDTAAGTEAAPLATVEAGLARLRQLRSRGGLGPTPAAPAPAELVLRAGTHYLRATAPGQALTLGPADSQLTIRGYGGGERAVVSGGTPLSLHWTRHVPPPTPPTSSSPPLRHTIWSAAIPANVTAFASLYFGGSGPLAGRRAVRARTPDANAETEGLHTPANTGERRQRGGWLRPGHLLSAQITHTHTHTRVHTHTHTHTERERERERERQRERERERERRTDA